MARARGIPKTGGRKAGTPNKATADVKAAAQQHAPAALERLAWLTTNASSEAAQVAACKEILDRAYGKPPVAIVGGEDAAPVVFTFNLDKANALTAPHLDG